MMNLSFIRTVEVLLVIIVRSFVGMFNWLLLSMYVRLNVMIFSFYSVSSCVVSSGEFVVGSDEFVSGFFTFPAIPRTVCFFVLPTVN